MTERLSLQRLILLGLAVLFAAATLSYGGFWAYSVRWQAAVSMGFAFEKGSLHIADIDPEGPADVAGLRPLDRLVAVDGNKVETQLAVTDSLRERTADTEVQLTVNLAGLNRLRTYYATLAPAPVTGPDSWSRILALELVRAYPLLFLLAVALMLFLLFDFRDAWLMALGLSGMLVAWVPLPFENVSPDMRGVVFAFKTAFGGLGPALLFYFFTVFPARSPLDEMEPRAKELFLAASAIVVVPAALWVFVSPEITQQGPGRAGFWLLTLASVAAVTGAVISFVGNLMSPPSAEAVSKIETVTLGALVALVPGLLLGIALLALGRPAALWVTAPVLLMTLLLPVTLGYVMIAREVQDTPVLLQQLSRFLLVQRGHVVVLVCIGLGLAFPLSEWIHGLLRKGTAAALPIALGSLLAFVTTVVWGGMRLHRRVSGRIDRALFPDCAEPPPPAAQDGSAVSAGASSRSRNGRELG